MQITLDIVQIFFSQSVHYDGEMYIKKKTLFFLICNILHFRKYNINGKADRDQTDFDQIIFIILYPIIHMYKLNKIRNCKKDITHWLHITYFNDK